MKKLHFLIILFPVLMNAQNLDNTALIIVDIQHFYFPEGKMELVNPEKASKNAKSVLEYFRKEEKPVIHVRHNFEPGGEIHQDVKPLEGEKTISKDHVNSFKGTDLLDHLQNLKIETLVICGMQTHMCVEAVTRAAHDFDFKCILIEDACATKNLEYKDKIIQAEDVHFSTISTLKSYAEIVDTESFLNK